MSSRALALALAVGAVAISACGGLDAQTFTERIREQGVEIELGSQLRSEEDGVEVWDFRLPPVVSGRGEGARGTLEVFESEKASEAGFARCITSADLTCYRAGEVVVVLPSDGLEARRLAAAMRRLAG